MRFAKSGPEASATPLAPLLDVVLLLLIFFVVTSSFATATLELDLPSAESAEAAGRDGLVVALDAQGMISIEGRSASRDSLPTHFAEASRLARPVELRADRRTDYEHVVAVLDAARLAGVVDIAMGVERRAGPRGVGGLGGVGGVGGVSPDVARDVER